MHILDFMAGIPRLGVVGAAGTGKTLVAMERARRLAAEGRRVLLLCYNRALGEHLKSLADGFEVSTFHALCRDCATAASIPMQTLPSDPGELQHFYDDVAPEQMMQALQLMPDKRYDAIVVDEGQDFAELWWVAIDQLLADQSERSLWVFYDPRQNIFKRPSLASLNLVPATLTQVCRNTGNIARFAYDYIGCAPTLRDGAPEGVAVRIERVTSPAGMADALRRTLHALIVGDKVSPQRIVVLSPLNRNSKIVGRVFGNYRVTDQPESASDIRFASLQGFKGLEADVIVLCEVTPGSPASSPENLYVATSRAKHVLVVLEYAGTDPAEGPHSRGTGAGQSRT